MGPIGQISPDGTHYWNGQEWVTTLSPNGRWRWDGHTWIAALPGIAAGPAGVKAAGALASIPGFKTGAPWKIALIGGIGLVLVAVWASALAGSNSPPAPSSGQQVSQQDVALTPSPTTPVRSASPSTHPSPSPTPSPSSIPSPSPSPTPVAPPPAPADRCGAPPNPWGYNFCGGNNIYSPPSTFCTYFVCIATFWTTANGYVVECNDAAYSHSGGQSGVCSHHGGMRQALYSS